MHWSDIENIVDQLETAYLEEEIPEYDLPYIKEMVLSLHEFDDHEVDVNNSTLKQILESWIDLRSEK